MTQPELHWTEGEAPDLTHHSARWRSESGAAPPKRVVLADDRTTADAAYRLACEGSACCGVATSRMRASCCRP